MENLNKIELQMLIDFLKDVRINQADSSCNDYISPATENTKAFMEIFNKEVSHSDRLELQGNEVIGLDISITDYFIKKLEELKK